MNKVLPNIINEDPSGFIKGRTISENIKLIDDIIQYTDKIKCLAYFYLSILKKRSIRWIGPL